MTDLAKSLLYEWRNDKSLTLPYPQYLAKFSPFELIIEDIGYMANAIFYFYN